MADVAAVSMARLKEFSSRVLVSIAWDLGTLSRSVSAGGLIQDIPSGLQQVN